MNAQHCPLHRALLTLVLALAALTLFLGAPVQAAPPNNDDFNNATVIAALPTTIVQDTSEATWASDDPSCILTGNTVWFSFTPAEDHHLVASTFGSDHDTILGVYTGSRGSLTEIGCNDDAGSLQSGVDFAAQAGVTYYIQAGAYRYLSSGGELHFNLSAAVPPPHDDFDDAALITALPFTAGLDILAATAGDDDPLCFGAVPSVWFAFTPAEDLTVSADTFASNFDTTLCVYAGERGSLTELGRSDESFDRTQSYVAFEAQAGETYTFMVGKWESDGLADLVFTLQEIEPFPANDDFDGASVAGELPFISVMYTGNLTEAEDDPADCRQIAVPTAWFAFTPVADITVEAQAIGSDFRWLLTGSRPSQAEEPEAIETSPGIIGVYTGERGALTPVGCAIERVRFEARSGETYYFMISSLGWMDTAFTKVLFTLKEAPPEAPNDDFDDAIAIPSLPFSDRTYTSTATRGHDDPSLPGCGTSVWYTFTPERSLWVTVDTAGSDYDTLLGLFIGERGALSRLATNDDYGESLQARLTHRLEGGETAYLMVCAHISDTPYNLVLNVQQHTFHYWFPSMAASGS